MVSWYYLKDGCKFGPVSATKLKSMADNGELLVSDLIWKQGMPDWQAAGTRKGLFNAGSPVEARQKPVVRTDVPAVTDAAKNLASVTSNVAVRFANEAASGINQMNSNKVKSIVKKWAKIIGIFYALMTVFSFAVLALLWALGELESDVANLKSSGPDAVAATVVAENKSKPKLTMPQGGYTRVDGTGGYMMSAADIPPPVVQAVADGMQVWQVSGYTELEKDRTLYVILKDDHLEALVPVRQESPSDAELYYGKENAPDRDVFGWSIKQPVYSSSRGNLEWKWTLTKAGNQWTLAKTQRLEIRPSITTTETAIEITMDEEVGEGFWRMSRKKNTKFRGSLARFPDKDEIETDEGAFWPVPW